MAVAGPLGDGRVQAWYVDGEPCDDLPDLAVAGEDATVLIARSPVD